MCLIEYQYSVGEQACENDAVSCWGLLDHNRFAETNFSKFVPFPGFYFDNEEPKNVVEVSYSPEEPSISYLDVGSRWHPYFNLLFGIAILGFAFRMLCSNLTSEWFANSWIRNLFTKRWTRVDIIWLAWVAAFGILGRMAI